LPVFSPGCKSHPKKQSRPSFFSIFFLQKNPGFWSKNIAAAMAQDGMAMNLADEILVVDPQEAMKTAMDLARSASERGGWIWCVRFMAG
jgi:cysteine synthase